MLKKHHPSFYQPETAIVLSFEFKARPGGTAQRASLPDQSKALLLSLVLPFLWSSTECKEEDSLLVCKANKFSKIVMNVLREICEFFFIHFFPSTLLAP
jgi:hypothetical protein